MQSQQYIHNTFLAIKMVEIIRSNMNRTIFTLCAFEQEGGVISTLTLYHSHLLQALDFSSISIKNLLLNRLWRVCTVWKRSIQVMLLSLLSLAKRYFAFTAILFLQSYTGDGVFAKCSFCLLHSIQSTHLTFKGIQAIYICLLPSIFVAVVLR